MSGGETAEPFSPTAYLRAGARRAASASPENRRIAVFLPGFSGGGVANMMPRLAAGLAGRGHPVDLLVVRSDASYLAGAPSSINVVTLKETASWRARLDILKSDPGGFSDLLKPVLLPRKGAWELRCLPDLVAYLRHNRPVALISGKIYPTHILQVSR